MIHALIIVIIVLLIILAIFLFKNRKYSDLYLIGNGFDIHHGLPSKYSDFWGWLSSERPELESMMSEYYDCSGEWWKTFEESLGHPKLSEYIALTALCNQPNLASDNFHDSEWYNGQYQAEREVGSFVDELQDAFTDWVRSELSYCSLGNKLKIKKSRSYFINFNYTDTLEKVYSISKNNIWHPHGSLDDGEVVFGHGRLYHDILSEYTPDFDIPEITEGMTDGEYNELLNFVNPDQNDDIISQMVREAAVSEISKLEKPVARIIDVNLRKFKNLHGVRRIHIYGLSLSDVDLKYFDTVRQYSSSFYTKWEFSYYSPDDEARVDDVISKLRICHLLTSKIKLTDIEETKQLELF